jgi:hypothetical protein
MRKVLPLVAGVSNVFLRDTWIDNQGATKILDYFRVAPTGPAIPLVLAPTTIGGHMNIGVTYRMTGFTRARIDGILDSFMDQIERVDMTSKPMPSRRTATGGRVSHDQPSPALVGR